MSLKDTRGAESLSSASFAWNLSCASGGRPLRSMNDATCPTFIAAPFIWPSTSTICSAALSRSRAFASSRSCSPRVRLAALLAYARAAWPPTSPPTFAVRRTRPVGIGFSPFGGMLMTLRARVGCRPMAERRVVIDHLTIGVPDLARSRAFYAAALEPLGFREMGAWSAEQREIAFGYDGGDDFAISTQYEPGGQVHVAFSADSREAVDAFHSAALRAGGRDNGAPGERPEYAPGYYGAFVLDLDGHNVEAVWHGGGGGGRADVGR